MRATDPRHYARAFRPCGDSLSTIEDRTDRINETIHEYIAALVAGGAIAIATWRWLLLEALHDEALHQLKPRKKTKRGKR